MLKLARRLPLLALAALVAVALANPASAAKDTFLGSDDSKEKDEPQEFLKDYDKLTKGAEVDWVYYSGSPKDFKKVLVKPFDNTGKGSRAKMAAEEGQEYMEQWIQRSKKLGWDLGKKSDADLIIEGNVFNAWEPSGAARFWGGWYANPGCGIEIMGKDAKGNVVFQIRHKSKGSTISDAVENALENVVETLEKGK